MGYTISGRTFGAVPFHGAIFLVASVGVVVRGSVGSALSVAPAGFAQPITVTVAYSDAATLHLDESRLAVYRWDESNGSWAALTTTVDVTQNQAIAQTMDIGNFDLQAPLLCPADSLKPNDNYYASASIPVDATVMNSLFDGAQDEDWFRFDAAAAGKYVVQTNNLATGVDTVIQIYDMDGLTMLISDDNGGSGLASRVEWRAPLTGTYFIRISRSEGGAYGCTATYQLSVEQTFQQYLPFVRK